MTFRYAGLEPVGVSAANVTVNGVDNPLFQNQDLIKVSAGGGGTVLVQIRDPTDTSNLAESQSITIAPLTSLTINGGAGADTVRFTSSVNLGAASLTVHAESIVLDPGITLTAGDILLDASASLGTLGTPDTGLAPTVNASIDDNGANIIGHDITFHAGATLISSITNSCRSFRSSRSSPVLPPRSRYAGTRRSRLRATSSRTRSRRSIRPRSRMQCRRGRRGRPRQPGDQQHRAEPSLR